MAGFFWGLSLENTLDRGDYTLEELLDEEDVIQGCKCSNSRLINFLQGKEQVKRMVQYLTTIPPEGSDNDKNFRYSFVSCAVLTSEVEVILKSLVDDEEIMDSLFSFLDPDHERENVLAGYFSKVVICLLLRKTEQVMNYIQNHRDILKKMVDLIGLIPIMEVLMRLVGADDQIYTFLTDAVQWLAETELLDMLVDKLNPSSTPEVNANVATTLCGVTRLPQSALALKLSSPRFVSKLFTQALENPSSKSTLVHSLSVLISLLEPKKAAAGRAQTAGEQVSFSSPDTLDGMLEKLGDLLRILDISEDNTVLPTTYGELRPPFGSHRLKIVEFISVLLRADPDRVGQALVEHRGLQLLLNHFFDYPFNNMLHHHVESIVLTCIKSTSTAVVDNLFQDCDLIRRLLEVNKNPLAPDTRSQSKGKKPPRVGNIGHLTRIANQLTQAENEQVQTYLQANSSWVEWKSTILQERNAVENVYQWACGRPMPIQTRPMDSDEDDFRDRDYDVSTMAGNMTREVFGMFDNDSEEDVFFDDDSAEVVINSLRLSDEQESTRLPWFAFQDDETKDSLSLGLSPPRLEDGQIINFSLANSGSSSSDDDEVVLGEDDELADTATSSNELHNYSSSLEYSGHENGDVQASYKPGMEEDEDEEGHEEGEEGNKLVGITSDLEAVDLVDSSKPKVSGEDGESSQFDGGTRAAAAAGSTTGLDQNLDSGMDIDMEARNGTVEVDKEIIKHSSKQHEQQQFTGVESEAMERDADQAKSVGNDSVTADVVEFNDVNCCEQAIEGLEKA